MEVAKLILEYINAIIWPAVALIAILTLRKKIPTLLTRVRSVEAFGASLTFSEEIREAQRSLDQEEDKLQLMSPSPTNDILATSQNRPIEDICNDLLAVIPKKSYMLDPSIDNGYIGLSEVHWSVNAILLSFGISTKDPEPAIRLVEMTGVTAWVPVIRAATQIEIVDPGESVLIGASRPPTAKDLSGRAVYLSSACDEILDLLRRTIIITRIRQRRAAIHTSAKDIDSTQAAT